MGDTYKLCVGFTKDDPAIHCIIVGNWFKVWGQCIIFNTSRSYGIGRYQHIYIRETINQW